MTSTFRLGIVSPRPRQTVSSRYALRRNVPFPRRTKRSYLDRGILNALAAKAKLYAREHHQPLLLLARYIPPPSAERLMASGINFLDQAGNMQFCSAKTLLSARSSGARKRKLSHEATRISPAVTQLLFTFATHAKAGGWAVRRLAEVSGLSKSNVAKIKNQLVARGILRKSTSGFALHDPAQLEDELLRGYESALRPKILIGRFRPR